MMDRKYDNSLHMMEVLGGSFVKSLAHCYYMADPVNKRKLKETFAHYFDKYEAQFVATAPKEQP